MFIGYKERNLTEHAFYSRFREILWFAGIPHQGRGKGPRVHDLRHTFAVHCLNKWVDEGRDIYTVLPILSNYLGHSSISATSHYLRLTPVQFPQIVSIMEEQSGLIELYPDIIAKVEKSCSYVIPEVQKNYES